MAQDVLQHGTSIPTLSTSYIPAKYTGEPLRGGLGWRTGEINGNWTPHGPGDGSRWQGHGRLNLSGLGSTGKGILIGMLSAFGSAAFVALIIAIVYFFRYTNRGRVILDRIGRPGEFDDEQQFLRDEEEALAEMDDSQRAEYHRAKGELTFIRSKRLYGY